MKKFNNSLNKILISFVFASVAAPCFASGKGSNPNGKPFIELQGQIIEVEGQISSLQDQVDSIVGRVDSLEARIAAEESAIANLTSQNSEIQAQIDAYGEDIASIQNSIDLLQAENQTLQAQIDNNAGDIAALQADLDYNNGLILQFQQTVNSLTTLQSQIDNNNDLILTMQDEIELINSRLALKQNIINGTCPDGEAVRQINPDGSVSCQSAGGGGSGSLNFYLVYGYKDLPKGQKGNVMLKCEAGDHVTGGGFIGGWKYRGMEVWESRPGKLYSGLPTDPTDIWKVEGRNNFSWTDNLLAYAICLSEGP